MTQAGRVYCPGCNAYIGTGVRQQLCGSCVQKARDQVAPLRLYPYKGERPPVVQFAETAPIAQEKEPTKEEEPPVPPIRKEEEEEDVRVTTMIGGREYEVNPRRALPARARAQREHLLRLVEMLGIRAAAKNTCWLCKQPIDEASISEDQCEACFEAEMEFLEAIHKVTSYSQVGLEYKKLRQWAAEYRGDENKLLGSCLTCGTLILIDKWERKYQRPLAEFCSADCYEANQIVNGDNPTTSTEEE